MVVQYDLFETREDSEITSLREGFKKTQESSERVRKKLFAENGRMKLEITELRERLEIIERNICKN